MANIKSAKKRIRQTITKTYQNNYYRIQFKKAKKAIKKAVVAKTDKKTIAELLTKFYSIVDKCAKKNIFHKNKASRLKSRISKMVLKS
ncbi:MAG: 30S ribosomal protein S20 [Patescibacteria group bacterium]|nr:MAG: 30S ribosomal protein S20 [Patescibacteria group bacterium]GIW63739.1 MAG: 30S ribosomal protein S20 [Patescibacteria group bacterium]GIW64049.1 MAG: 30S ribosomal protein S20 [Patescibacteria group bacterium]